VRQSITREDANETKRQWRRRIVKLSVNGDDAQCQVKIGKYDCGNRNRAKSYISICTKLSGYLAMPLFRFQIFKPKLSAVSIDAL